MVRKEGVMEKTKLRMEVTADQNRISSIDSNPDEKASPQNRSLIITNDNITAEKYGSGLIRLVRGEYRAEWVCDCRCDCDCTDCRCTLCRT